MIKLAPPTLAGGAATQQLLPELFAGTRAVPVLPAVAVAALP